MTENTLRLECQGHPGHGVTEFCDGSCRRDEAARLVYLDHYGSAYGLWLDELVQYPVSVDGTVDLDEGAAVDFDRGVDEGSRLELLEVKALLEAIDGNPRRPRVAAAARARIEAGAYREARALLKAYATDAELKAAEDLSDAQDYTDGGGPVDADGRRIDRY